MPHFGQELFLASEKKGPLTDAEYKAALEKDQQMSRAEGIDAALKAHHLDALVALSGGPAWTTDLVNGDHYLGIEHDAGGRRRLSEHHRAGR